MKLFFFKLIILRILINTDAWNPPDYVHKCTFKDPKVADCWRQNFEAVLARGNEPIPDLYMPRIDPGVYDEVNLNMGSLEDPLYFRAHITNITAYGLSKTKLDYIYVSNDDPKHLLLNATLSNDFVYGHANYKAKGKIFFAEFDSEGMIYLNVTNAVVYSNFTGKIYKKKGVDYFNYKLKYADMEFDAMELYFTNIFKDNEELTIATNQAIKDNFKTLEKEVKPVVSETVIHLANQMIKEICELIPANELYN